MRKFDYTELGNRIWDNKTLMLVAQIHEYKGRQDMYLAQKAATLDKLVEIAKVQSTEASNKIEGIVTTQSRLKQICAEKTTPRNRDEEEISGYRDVLKIIHESYEYIPLSENYILQMHDILYRYSGRGIGGKFKKEQNYICDRLVDGTQVVRFTPLSPLETPEAVRKICKEYRKAIDNGIIDPLLLIPVFISDFLCIHPFNDGNGRMSRLLTTLLLYRSGYMVGRYISLEAKIERNKELYYDVLQVVSEKWHEGENDPVPFIKYLLGIVLAAYRDVEERVSLVGEKKDAGEIVRETVKKKIGKFTKRELMGECPEVGKTSVENVLKKMVEGGEVQAHGKGKNTFYTRKD